jgi:hypothetical protein
VRSTAPFDLITPAGADCFTIFARASCETYFTRAASRGASARAAEWQKSNAPSTIPENIFLCSKPARFAGDIKYGTLGADWELVSSSQADKDAEFGFII